MKSPKNTPKVKQIVDAASQGINQGLEEARHLFEKSESEEVCWQI